MSAIYTYHNGTFLMAVIGWFLRIGTSVSLAGLVTGTLLFLMCSLIAMDPPEIIDDNITIRDVVLSEQRDIIEQVEPTVEKPLDPQPQPQVPQFTQSVDPGEGIEISMVPTIDPVTQPMGTGHSSGTAMPIFKVAPQYPRRLQSRGVEGFVDLMFDITATGKTENIRVIYAEPNGAFERSSVKALTKWKYKPAINDGVAIVQKNQTTRITYALEK